MKMEHFTGVLVRVVKMNYRINLWKLGLLKESRCPLCNTKLIKVGFENESHGSQHYICNDNKCKFNKLK
jgi:uncharacterized protein with PIN domain